MRNDTFYTVDNYCANMGGPTAGTVDCSVGVIVPESPNPELDELRELRSSKLEKKDLPQEFCLWKRTARSSETLGCIIVDTCAVIHEPDIIEISIKNKILVVVPFPVLCELDKLHKSGKYSSHKKAQQAMHCLKKSSMSQHLIFEDSSESLNEVNGFKVAKNNNDDLILRCAFKIQVNLPADCVDSRIFFITDDCNLSLKAHAHHVKYLTAKQYLAELQKSGLSITLEPEEEPMEIDPPQDPVIPPQDIVKAKDQPKGPAKKSAKEKECKPTENLVKKPLNGHISKHHSRKGLPKKKERQETNKVKDQECEPPVRNKTATPVPVKTKNSSEGEGKISKSIPVPVKSKSLPTSARSKSPLAPVNSSTPVCNQENNVQLSQRLSVPTDPHAVYDVHWNQNYYYENSQTSYYAANDAAYPAIQPHPYPGQYGTSWSHGYPNLRSRSHPYSYDNSRPSGAYRGSQKLQKGLSERRFNPNQYHCQSYDYQKQRSSWRNWKPKVPTKMVERLSIVDESQHSFSRYSSRRGSVESLRTKPNNVDVAQDQGRKIFSEFISPAENAISKFAEIWNGLVGQIREKIEHGHPPPKVCDDLRNLWKAAATLCQKTDLQSFKEFVSMATSLYYFWTLNPDYQNLEFPTSALSSALQLMRSESSEKGVELANSILCYVNDDRMRLEENSNIAQ